VYKTGGYRQSSSYQERCWQSLKPKKIPDLDHFEEQACEVGSTAIEGLTHRASQFDLSREAGWLQLQHPRWHESFYVFLSSAHATCMACPMQPSYFDVKAGHCEVDVPHRKWEFRVVGFFVILPSRYLQNAVVAFVIFVSNNPDVLSGS